MANPISADAPLQWPEESSYLGERELNRLLLWASDIGASDIRLQTGRHIVIHLHGRIHKVTRRKLLQHEIASAVDCLYAADGMAVLKTAVPFDVAYEIEPVLGGARYRYRVNAKSVLARGHDGAGVVIRTMPGSTRPIDTQNVEPGIMGALCPPHGMVIVSGGTGEGKSGLLASVVRHKLEDPRSNRVIVELGAPIEQSYDDIIAPTSEVTQIEVPRHILSFDMGIRDAMRSAAHDIIVSEVRDTETLSAGIDASITHHAAYMTLHAGSIFETIQRLISLCPDHRRAEMTTAIAQILRLIVNRRLIRSTDGTRTPIHEYFVFDQEFRRFLGQTDPKHWPLQIEMMMRARGTTFTSAIHRALDEGRIAQDVAMRHLREVNGVA